MILEVKREETHLEVES